MGKREEDIGAKCGSGNGMTSAYLAVQVQGLPHERQGDEFLDPLAPGSREEFS